MGFQLFKKYLYIKIQPIKVKNTLSEPKILEYEVPQRTLLCNIYITDLIMKTVAEICLMGRS